MTWWILLNFAAHCLPLFHEHIIKTLEYYKMYSEPSFIVSSPAVHTYYFFYSKSSEKWPESWKLCQRVFDHVSLSWRCCGSAHWNNIFVCVYVEVWWCRQSFVCLGPWVKSGVKKKTAHANRERGDTDIAQHSEVSGSLTRGITLSDT